MIMMVKGSMASRKESVLHIKWLACVFYRINLERATSGNYGLRESI